MAMISVPSLPIRAAMAKGMAAGAATMICLPILPFHMKRLSVPSQLLEYKRCMREPVT